MMPSTKVRSHPASLFVTPLARVVRATFGCAPSDDPVEQSRFWGQLSIGRLRTANRKLSGNGVRGDRTRRVFVSRRISSDVLQADFWLASMIFAST